MAGNRFSQRRAAVGEFLSATNKVSEGAAGSVMLPEYLLPAEDPPSQLMQNLNPDPAIAHPVRGDQATITWSCAIVLGASLALVASTAPANFNRESICEDWRFDMRFARKLSVALITTGLGGAMPPLAAQAISVQTVQDPVPSGSEPVRGQGLTINVGSIPPDALIPPTVQLDLVGFRMGDNGIGSADRPAVYLHVCDDFGLNGDGTANRGAIGSLLAVSTNTLNLETPAPSTDLISTFAGPTLNKGPTYHYVMANNTTAATSGDFSNLIYRDLEVAFANPPTGGQAYVQTGDEPSPDLYFRVLSSFDSVPERWTSAPALGGLLMLGWITWRQKGV